MTMPAGPPPVGGPAAATGGSTETVEVPRGVDHGTPQARGTSAGGAAAADAVSGSAPGLDASAEAAEQGARGQSRRKRRTGLSRPARLAALGVAAVVLGAATVGIQVWDRSLWVAARYPAEAVQEVRPGESAVRAGMRWSVEVSRAPRNGDRPGRIMLQVTVLVTPVEEKAIEEFFSPTIELRDTAERKWVTITAPGGTPIRTDMRVGRTDRFTAYGVVPEDLVETAKVALVFIKEDGSDVLLFNR